MAKIHIFAVSLVLGYFSFSPVAQGKDDLDGLADDIFATCEPNLMPYINIDIQDHYTSPVWNPLFNEKPLLTVTDESIFQDYPVISKMIQLFDKYDADSSHDEPVSDKRDKQIKAFLNELLNTKAIQMTMNHLAKKGIVSRRKEAHYALLHRTWFEMYRRDWKHLGSSGFEHSFLAETKKGLPIGIHNWIYYYFLQQNRLKHKLKYTGYAKRPLALGNEAEIVKFRLVLNGATKPVNSMFVGTHPECEFALYTLCFELKRGERCNIQLANKSFFIQTYEYENRGKKSGKVASAYPGW